MWPYQTCLSNNKMFGKKTKIEAGLNWWAYGRLTSHKLRTPLSITFAFVATNNHFVLDSGGKIFNRSAPVIKMPPMTCKDTHLALIGLLNSSVACFWMKQIFHNKGSTVDQHGARQRTDAFEDFYEFTSTGLDSFPVIKKGPTDIATRLETLATQLATTLPTALLPSSAETQALPTRASLTAARAQAAQLRRQMIASQEELDWRCYRLYDLLPTRGTTLDFESSAPPEVALGERAFEIILARRMAAGTEQTTWFERHGSTPITEIPSHWPEDYRSVMQRRIDLIERDRNIALIERPEYKRRWNTPSWESLEQAALRDWLLAHLEACQGSDRADQGPTLTSTNRLADAARQDSGFMQMAELYTGHPDFDVGQLVGELVGGEAVPFLPVLRYADTGLRKRAQWQDTWILQRREDEIDAEVEATADAKRQGLMADYGTSATESNRLDTELRAQLDQEKAARKAAETGNIPVPPKYQSKDFSNTAFWRLRGGLDVPKERWISFPGCERGADGSLTIAWAGWDHLQQATALATFYLDVKDHQGWPPERLQPLLAGLQELVPWLKQWHNALDPVYGERMGDYYQGFVIEEARALGWSLDDLRGWKPAATAAKRARRKATS